MLFTLATSYLVLKFVVGEENGFKIDCDVLHNLYSFVSMLVFAKFTVFIIVIELKFLNKHKKSYHPLILLKFYTVILHLRSLKSLCRTQGFKSKPEGLENTQKGIE